MLTVTYLLIVVCSNNRKEIVAEFGNQKITLEEFRIAYLDVIKKPNAFDSPKYREKFLDELIKSRILAREAEKRKDHNEKKLQYKVNAYKNKVLRETHFDAVIRPRFLISEKEIQEAYIYTQEKRKISHLFANTKNEIDSLYSLLKKGRSFEKIAKELFNDPTLAESGGDLGWVTWDALEYDLAMTAFRIPIDTFSVPVRSQFGYHILKITDYKKKPLITKQEYESHKRKAKSLLEFKLGDNYAYSYINDLFKKAEIQLNPEIITAVRSKLKNIFQRKPNQFNQMNDMQLTYDEVRVVERNLWDMRDETFATINGIEYSVADFIGELNYIPYGIIYSSFRKAMNYAFRDFLIDEEARQMGLENSAMVKIKHDLYKEYLLQSALRKEIIENVKVSENEIKIYYELNKSNYKGAGLAQVEKMITDILMRKKKSEAVPKFVDELLENKEVVKNHEIIHNYYDSILN
jgi:parvulin-like peptidyl-prolyl isomerase